MCTRQVLYHLTRPPAIIVKDYFKQECKTSSLKERKQFIFNRFFFHIPLHGLLEGKYPHSDCVVNFHSSGRQWERMLNHTHCWSVIQHLFNPTDYKEFLNGLFFHQPTSTLLCHKCYVVCVLHLSKLCNHFQVPQDFWSLHFPVCVSITMEMRDSWCWPTKLVPWLPQY